MAAMTMSEADGFAGSLAKVIEFCPPCSAASNRLNSDDVRGMQREDSFDALVIDYSAYRECFVDSAASASDYSAGKYLYTLFFALFYAAADIYGIAYFKVRYFFLETFAFNGIKHFGLGGRSSFFFLCHIVTCSNSYLLKHISFEIKAAVYKLFC
jgi:hypothetical protein